MVDCWQLRLKAVGGARGGCCCCGALATLALAFGSLAQVRWEALPAFEALAFGSLAQVRWEALPAFEALGWLVVAARRSGGKSTGVRRRVRWQGERRANTSRTGETDQTDRVERIHRSAGHRNIDCS